MEKYLSLAGERVTERVIEKSRFICTTRHVEGEEQAKEFIAAVRARYKDATHNCYAYIADSTGNFLRFSDDGEPQGTAGMPMLEVLRANGLKQVAAVVTRYFGGIKLGAGGLVRAYSGAVAENVAAARKVCYEPCVKSAYTVEYPLTDAALRYFSESDCSLEESEYADRVTFTVAVKSALSAAFDGGLVNRLNGKLQIKKLQEYMHPFDV